MHQLLIQLQQIIQQPNVVAPTVSKVGTYWHADHTLRVINNIIKALQASNPSEYSRKFNLARILVLTTGIIPRGKARAPKAVLPPNDISQQSLQLQLHDALGNIELISTLEKNKHFAHPYFGFINVPTTNRFLQVHTKHHINIINDIFKAN